MIITNTNALRGTTPSILNGASTDAPANITDPDFSLNYTASGNTLTVDFGSVNCTYFAIAGYDAHGGTVELLDGGSSLTVFNTSFSGNQVLIYQFDVGGTKNPRVRIVSGDGTPPTLSYGAAGFFFTVPNNGEVQGYSRQWMTRQERTRVQGNMNAAPIASLSRKEALRGRLSIPNMNEIIARPDGGWGGLLKFASQEPFFMLEYDRNSPIAFLPESGYICFEPQFIAPRAHPQTRRLVNASLNFKCFNGL